MIKEILRDAFNNMNLHYELDYPMKKLTTFGVGGPAAAFVKIRTVSELEYVLNTAERENLPVFIIGKGSNLLVSDKGFKGIVLSLEKELAHVRKEENLIRAGAGYSLIKLSQTALEYSLGGLEFAANIPGTVGGAVFMNAGAYGNCIFDRIQEITVWSGKNKIQSYSPPFDYGYRYSFLQQSREIVLSVVLSLSEEKKEAISRKMKQRAETRKQAQPVGKKTAGSVFKNPAEHKAYELINKAGLQGLAVGDAAVSKKHSNFIVNKGRASAEDIYRLIKVIQDKVKAEYNIMLETEIEMLGEFE